MTFRGRLVFRDGTTTRSPELSCAGAREQRASASPARVSVVFIFVSLTLGVQADAAVQGFERDLWPAFPGATRYFAVRPVYPPSVTVATASIVWKHGELKIGEDFSVEPLE